MSASAGEPGVITLLDRIDGVRTGLIGLLRAKDPARYAERPPSGEWSIVENVRHLLFAEQLHLGKFVPEGVTFSSIGLTPDFAKDWPDFAGVNTEPSDDLEEVLQAWDTAHKSILDVIIDSEDADLSELQSHLDHLVFHLDIINALLGESNG